MNGYDQHSASHMSRRAKRTASGDWRQAPFRETVAPAGVTPQQINESFAAAFPAANITEAVPPQFAKKSGGGSSDSDSSSSSDSGGKSVSAGGETYDISTEAKAKSAISKVRADGKPADVTKVQNAVYRAYPDLKPGGSDSSSSSSRSGSDSSSSSGSSSKGSSSSSGSSSSKKSS